MAFRINWKGIGLVAASAFAALSLSTNSKAEIVNLSVLTNSGVYSAFGQFETNEGTFLPGQGVLYADHLRFLTPTSADPFPTADILFRSAADGGGITYLGDSNFDLRGAQIYTGQALPNEDYGYQQFGEYGSIDGGPSTYYQVFLTASDPADFFAAPEPATWALMLMGVGILGFSLRRRSGRKAPLASRNLLPAVTA